MSYTQGDWVRASGSVCLVEMVYQTEEGEFLTVRRPDGHRQVWASHEVKPNTPPAEVDPVRREAVDRILEYKGVPREYLFEYPYNEHESRTRITEAEGLLDDLLELLGKQVDNRA